MTQTLTDIFKALERTSAPAYLEERVLSALKRAERREYLFRLLARGGLLGSVCFGVWAVMLYGASFVGSEFWSLSALFFSDTAAVLSAGSSFVLSLLETFPLWSVIMLLLPLYASAVFLSLVLSERSLGRMQRAGMTPA